jgi:tRNA (mo5U34)-methyltransferase
MDLAEKIKAIPYWYHRIELPGGVVTPGWSPIDPARYCIPEDLTGKRVLDIGAWDGYWTWEALRRGAKEVVAIDDFSDDLGAGDKLKRNKWETFDLCREAFGFTIESIGWSNRWENETSQFVSRTEMTVYDLAGHPKDYVDTRDTSYLGRFDIVFFFGTIYHLKHPLLALEAISKVCDGALYVETASLDEYSPYRGGIGKGFTENEMVMEFYPGKEYACNEGNWWTPTLQCLGAMMESVGFKDVAAWPLTDTPKEISTCRGFASGTKEPEKEPAYHPAEIDTQMAPVDMKVAAVMSVPRLGFQDNMQCAFGVFYGMRIPLINVQGAFWGQCLERGIQLMIDGGYEYILTVDYDTVFTRQDVEELLRLMHEHPEASAIIPMQVGRGNRMLLTSMKGRSGAPRDKVPLTELQDDTIKVASGHFGLTLLRVSDLLEIEHPWFHDKPNVDGQWGPGRIDADIWFWKLLERAGKTALLANRIVVGHLELLATWPDASLQPIYQMPGDFHDNGKPKNCWK